MLMSSSIVNVSKSFLEAQKSMDAVIKDSKNPFFKSNYATLNAVREACYPQLNKSGISVLQPTITMEGKNYVRTILLHESGEYMGSDTEIICAKAGDPQSQGSAISYARRYGLGSLVGLAMSDDDGEAAMNRSNQHKASEPAKTVPNVPVVQLPAAHVQTPVKASSFKKPEKPVVTVKHDDGGW